MILSIYLMHVLIMHMDLVVVFTCVFHVLGKIVIAVSVFFKEFLYLRGLNFNQHF